jgi:hypothetical protein
MDLLLWLLCSPPPGSSEEPHLPSKISSTGGLLYFRRDRKPKEAGSATNCLACDFEPQCKFSSKKIYITSLDPGLAGGNTEWPVDVVVPDIEECLRVGGKELGEKAILDRLTEDYDASTSTTEIESRPWFGRCVYESDNDVCDHQSVTLTFDHDPRKIGKNGKIATLNMVALTKKVCERYTIFSGTEGEISADSTSITVYEFASGKETIYQPHVADGGHGAGDGGLARQFVLAIDQIKNHGQSIEEAQREHIACSIEEVIRSHAAVFAAEEARKLGDINFQTWWMDNIEGIM